MAYVDSADPDQIAPLDWSRSTLFAFLSILRNDRTKSKI